MTAVNGRGHDNASAAAVDVPEHSAAGLMEASNQVAPGDIKALIEKLEVPFHPALIEWRVISTSKNRKRGQVIPYADSRAYTDRLNNHLTPAGWTRQYQLLTTANFERDKDKKLVAKVAVTCALTIFGVGTHSATGEEWADDPNAVTAAEAQAFKRAASCFGLGRYLYHFTGVWVDLDDHKQPLKVPQLAGWATPEGWRQGQRPPQQVATQPNVDSGSRTATQNHSQESVPGDAIALIRQIEDLQGPLGRGLYRGLLRTLAHAWQPNTVGDVAVLQRVLLHMQAAHRGLLRLDAALKTLGREALQPVLRQLKLQSLDRVDNLKTLEQIVLALEGLAGEASR